MPHDNFEKVFLLNPTEIYNSEKKDKPRFDNESIHSGEDFAFRLLPEIEIYWLK